MKFNESSDTIAFMKYLFTLLFLYNQLFSFEFKVVSYNVENLFDIKYNQTEYIEYIPNTTSNWNKKTLNIKINNISKVLSNINADIIALQEIESLEALKLLQNKLLDYKFITFIKNPSSAIGLGFLSKYEITDSKIIKIDRFDNYSRPALYTTFKINGKEFNILNTHWSSKKHPESSRIKYALNIYNYIKDIEDEYIIVGDLNSNYNEFQTFKFDKKLNDSDGITGINQVLNTTIDKNFISKNDILEYDKKVHYNLWLDLPSIKRFSYKFRNENNTPDNIILAPTLFNKKDIEYKDKSFKVFKPDYLYNNGKINRWQMKGKKHIGKGFSDHLPIMATFTTDTNQTIKDSKKSTSISTLYNIDTLKEPYIIKDAIVLYKYKDSAIIKQKDGRAIFLYNCAKELEVGNIYDLSVSNLSIYNGLKEIKSANIVNKKGKDDIKKYFLDGSKINIFNLKYQNEIITNLKGYFEKGYLHFDNKKIKLYAKDINILPSNKQNVIITSAHLGIYKGNPQLIIYKKSDYR